MNRGRGVDRRWGGLLILIVAIIAALAGVSRVKAVTGVPVAGPIPGPPLVGSCQNQPDQPGPPADTGTTIGALSLFPESTATSCARPHTGEVVAVFAGHDGLRYTLTGDDSYPYTALQENCSRLVRDYLGLPSAGFGTERRPSWNWVSQVPGDLVGPSSVQLDSRQGWAACIARPDGSEDRYYQGSLRDAYVRRALPPAVAACRQDLQPPAVTMAVPCRTPHRAEEFGRTIVAGDGTGRADLRRSCAAQARLVTGMDDETAGGRLAVQLATVSPRLAVVRDGQIPRTPQDDGQQRHPATMLACALITTGNRVLTGPLTGLGDGPVPVS